MPLKAAIWKFLCIKNEEVCPITFQATNATYQGSTLRLSQGLQSSTTRNVGSPSWANIVTTLEITVNLSFMHHTVIQKAAKI